MKICIIQGPFLPIPPFKGGAVEKMWYGLSKKFKNKKHKIFYISKKTNYLKNKEYKNGIYHLRVKGYDYPKNLILSKIYDLFYAYRACKKIPNDIDIIVTNTFFAPLLINKNLKKKIYIDVQRVPKKQMFLYKKCGRFRANSKFVHKKILSELGNKFKSKIKVIPNPLPFISNKIFYKKNYKKIMLYTGRIHPEKGLEILINAINQLDTDWELRIIGPYMIEQGGWGIEYLKKLKKISKNLQIKFFDPIFDKNKLNEEYKNASIFIYPSVSEQGETFGLSPLEAMSFGCVPIVSNIDCFKDFITNNKNGLIFNHRNKPTYNLKKKIKMLQNSKKLLKKLSNKAILVNKSHSLKKVADLFLDDFKNIVDKQKKLHENLYTKI